MKEQVLNVKIKERVYFKEIINKIIMSETFFVMLTSGSFVLTFLLFVKKMLVENYNNTFLLFGMTLSVILFIECVMHHVLMLFADKKELKILEHKKIDYVVGILDVISYLTIGYLALTKIELTWFYLLILAIFVANPIIVAISKNIKER